MACFLKSWSRYEMVYKCLIFPAVTKKNLHISLALCISYDAWDPLAFINNHISKQFSLRNLCRALADLLHSNRFPFPLAKVKKLNDG